MKPLPQPRADRVLRHELSVFGPFVAVETHDDAEMPTPPWLPLTDLLTRPEVLEARVVAVAAALGERRPPGAAGPIDTRVAASVAHLGIVARLLAPVIATRALPLAEPLDIDPAPATVWWQDVLGGPVPLSVVARPAPRAAAGSDTVADLLPRGVEAITALMADQYRLGASVAWGNVGSAANGAANSITWARPELTLAARSAADEILRDPRVDGGSTRSGPSYRRRSCCLIYRLAGDRRAICGDCVLQQSS